MKRITKIVLSAFAFSAAVLMAQESLAVGFSQGNQIDLTPISGDVMVHCPNQPPPPVGNGGPSTNYVRCSANLWSPEIADFFVGPQGMQADSVTLVSHRQDGSKREKSADYDSAQGRSKTRFNLGIWTLTQKPLLKLGVNKITYVLKKDDSVVAQGDFEVTVTERAARQCPYGSYFGNSSFDCQSGSTAICDRYFREHNYCQ